MVNNTHKEIEYEDCEDYSDELTLMDYYYEVNPASGDFFKSAYFADVEVQE